MSKDLENIEAPELFYELFRRGYFLKPAGKGIYIRSYIKNEDPHLKRIIKNRTSDLLEYMGVTYPNELLNEILTNLSKVEGYPTNVKNMILQTISQKIDVMVQEAESCDSPIEFELYQHLKHAVNIFNQEHGTYLWVHIQQSIVANGKNYRADLFIERISGAYPQLIIECDGHDFHEKTKEQAQRDKERDRDLQLAGYRVIHFTGSEIFKDPGKCAREVIKFLETMI